MPTPQGADGSRRPQLHRGARPARSAPCCRPRPSSSTSRPCRSARPASSSRCSAAPTSTSCPTPSSSARARPSSDFLHPDRVVIGGDDQGAAIRVAVALRRRARAAHGHRPGVGRDHQVRHQRLPGHQALLRQRRRRGLRGGRRRRQRRRARHGLRQAHRPRLPPPRPGLGRLVLPEGHLGRWSASPRTRATTSTCSQGVVASTRSSSTGSPTRSAPWRAATCRGRRRRRVGPHLQGPHRRPPRVAGPRRSSAACSSAGAVRPGLRPDRGRRSRWPSCPASRSCADPYAACEGAEVLVVLTEWDEFRWLDLDKVAAAHGRAPDRRRPQPARPRRARCGAGFDYDGIGRPDGPGRRHRGSRLPRLAPLRRAPRPGRRGRRRRQPRHRPRSTTSSTSSATTGFTFVEHDVSEYVWVPGAVDAVLHFASPASPQDYLELPIQTLKVGSLGTHNALGLAKAKGARFLLASTSEVYGDPAGPPPARDLLGPREPDRAAGRLRRGQALRRGHDDGLPPQPRPRRAHRAHLQHLRPAHAARRRPGRVELHRPGARRASRSPSTATAPRPAASATSTTRCGASWPCSTATSTGPLQHRQPGRVHDASSWPTWCSRSPASTPRSSTRTLPVDDPAQAPPRHHPGPHRAGLGAEGRPPRGPRPHGGVVPLRTRPGLTLPVPPVPVQSVRGSGPRLPRGWRGTSRWWRRRPSSKRGGGLEAELAARPGWGRRGAGAGRRAWSVSQRISPSKPTSLGDERDQVADRASPRRRRGSRGRRRRSARRPGGCRRRRRRRRGTRGWRCPVPQTSMWSSPASWASTHFLMRAGITWDTAALNLSPGP